MKALRVVLWLLGIYVVLALAMDAYIATAQPTMGDRTGVLRSFDEDGIPHETVLSIIDDGNVTWVESGHHFRGWYHRVVANSDVELTRGGKTRAYRAVPLDDVKTREHVIALMKRGSGDFGYAMGRAMLLFAEIKPVRLDPR